VLLLSYNNNYHHRHYHYLNNCHNLVHIDSGYIDLEHIDLVRIDLVHIDFVEEHIDLVEEHIENSLADIVDIVDRMADIDCSYWLFSYFFFCFLVVVK
jgi:hypothetical protein